MKRLPMILLAITVAALAVLITTLSPPSASAQECGPDPGWVHPCPEGDDDFPNSGAVVGIDTTGTFGADPPDGDCLVNPPSLILNGPTTIHRKSAVPDTIDTEIISMNLVGSGFTLNAGASTVNTNVLPSLGDIVERSDPETHLADSEFDVYFEILGGPVPMFNHDALTVKAVIDRVPPFNTTYLHPIGICLPLFTQPDEGVFTGINLVEAEHNTGPAPPVGGTVELLGQADSPADASSSSSARDYTTPIAAAAGAVAIVVLTAGGWYVRRRWLR